MIVAKLSGTTSHEAVKVAQVFNFDKLMIFIEPLLNEAQLFDIANNYRKGGYDAIVFDEGALFDEGAYLTARKLVEEVKPKVVVYKFPYNER